MRKLHRIECSSTARTGSRPDRNIPAHQGGLLRQAVPRTCNLECDVTAELDLICDGCRRPIADDDGDLWVDTAPAHPRGGTRVGGRAHGPHRDRARPAQAWRRLHLAARGARHDRAGAWSSTCSRPWRSSSVNSSCGNVRIGGSGWASALVCAACLVVGGESTGLAALSRGDQLAAEERLRAGESAATSPHIHTNRAPSRHQCGVLFEGDELGASRCAHLRPHVV